MAFHFKQFSVEDEKSSMRVGTDAVLLGTWPDVSGFTNILEVGTGCGVISLILAQRSSAKITAIDIHQNSISQASENFANSRWSNRLKACHTSFQNYSINTNEKFDFIVSNPPYFTRSLKSPDSGKNLARHDDHLPEEELFSNAKRLLVDNDKDIVNSPTPSFVIIIPFSKASSILKTASKQGFYLFSQLLISPKVNSPANRIILQFTKHPNTAQTNFKLNLRNLDLSLSKEYKDLTADFYLNL